MIEVSRLTRLLGPVAAVRDVSFAVERGQVLGLLGPNGAGKTTTLRVLATLLPPTSGSVRIGGSDVRDATRRARSVIGYLPELPPLYSEMRVSEFLAFMAGARHVPRKHRKFAVERAMEACDLGAVRVRLCGELSKGYRQRVGLAQAILHDPAVILLDEPTGGLDPPQLASFRSLIRTLSADRAVVLSSHLLGEVQALCTHAVVLIDGRVRASGALCDLTRSQSLEATLLRCLETTP